MPTYYPSQHSSYGQPVYSSSHGHDNRHHSQGAPHASNSGYYGQATSSRSGNNVIYVPTHSSSHGQSRRRPHGTQVFSTADGTQVIVQPSSRGHHDDHGHRHHDDRHDSGRRRSKHHHHHHLSFGERIRRFFGLSPKAHHHHHHHRSNGSSWGFLGRSRRKRYVDTRSGAEVDSRGRQIYRV